MKLAVLAAIATLTFASAPTLAAAAHGTSSPPPDLSMDATWPATLKNPPTTILKLGTLRIEFGKTTLEQVAQTLGVGRIAHKGDAGDSTTWLCYTVPGGANSSRLWLVSGELDGGKYVTGVTAKLVSDHPASNDACPILPKPYSRVALGNSGWIGVSDKQLTDTLGQPSHEADGWRMFDYSKTFKAPGCEEAQQDSSLWVRSRNGHVVRIQAYQTISC